jgi:hypothetical protein
MVTVCSRTGEQIEMRAKRDASLRKGLASAKQGVPGINLLTEALKAPGCGAAYADTFVKIEKII